MPVVHLEDVEAVSLCFSADGSALLAGSFEGELRALELPSGRELARIQLGAFGTVAMAVSPWNHVAVGGFNQALVWNPFLTGDPEKLEFPGQALDVAFSRDGRLAISVGYASWITRGASTNPPIVMILPMLQGDLVLLQGHPTPVSCVAFSPDGWMVATGGDDGSLMIWDAVSGERRAVVTPAHAGALTRLAWISDGARILTTAYDGTVRVWTPSGELLATLLSLDEDDYVAVTPDGHYSATKTGLDAIVLRTEDGLFAFEQFDLQLNRPDIVLAR